MQINLGTIAQFLMSKRLISTILSIITIILCTEFLYRSYSPYSITVNSDDAIPVIMSSEKIVNLKDNIFYWGQDRFGGLNFFLANFLLNDLSLRRVISIPAFLQYLNCFYVTLSFFLIIYQSPYRAALLLAAITPLVLYQSDQFNSLLRISQPYASQLFFLTASLILMLQCYLEKVKSSKFYLLAVCLFLGSWMNQATIVTAFCWLAALMVHSFLVSKKGFSDILKIGIALLIGGIFSMSLSLISSSHFNANYTGIVNAPEIFLAFTTYLNKIWNDMPVITWLFCISLFINLFSILSNHLCRESHLIKPFHMLFTRKDRFLIVMILLGGIVNLLIISAFKWFHMNNLSLRYTVPICFFLLLNVIILFKASTQNVNRKYVVNLFTAFIIFLNINQIYDRRKKDEPIILRESRTLLSKKDRIGIIGDYWHSYVYSFYYPKSIFATPHDGSCVRNRNYVNTVLSQKTILFQFANWRNEMVSEPPPEIFQFGRCFTLQGLYLKFWDRNWWEYAVTGEPLEVKIKLDSNCNKSKLTHALDNNIETRWSSLRPQAPGMWIELSFAEKKKIKGLVLVHGNSRNDFPRKLRIYTKDQETDRAKLVNPSQYRIDKIDSVLKVTFADEICPKQLRLVQTEISDEYWWSIHEIKVFGPPSVK